jgi:hypothetical protein
MDDRTSDTSAISTSRGDFEDRVSARDGNCVMTGPTFAEACHVIPQAKGRQVRSECLLYHSEFLSQAKYMINLVNYRNERLNPPLDDINDTRNGILLSVLLHHPFGASEVAFLQVSYSTQSSLV